MFPVPPIETVYAWRQGDLMAFIQRVERLHPEDRNFHIIEGLNLTPVRLLKLTDERIEALVTERHIQTTQGDIIESARDELARAIMRYGINETINNMINNFRKYYRS
ncbi:15391_t:CDS:2 [Gigaspora rosea]|nr:15391_t:CDS:2 [Gigaspora rosea]